MANRAKSNSAADSEFFELATQHLAGELGAEGVSKLFETLVTNERCRQTFVELSWQARLMSASLVPALQSLETADVDGATGANEAQLPAARSPVLGFLGGIVRGVTGSPLVSTLLVAAVIYGVFGFLAWDLRPGKLPSVAVVRDTTDVQWSKNVLSKSTDSSILSGEALKISSGTIHLELKAGASLIVEGPADWSIDDDNRVSLRAGKLTARVPKQAVGFTVETPTVRIVDLSTEFGVEVGEQGATEVQVFQGNVDVNYAELAQTDKSQRSVRMTAGTAKQFSQQGIDRGVTVKDVVPTMKKSLAKSTSLKSQPIVVQGVMASSESSTTRAQSLIDGSGMKGECHATYHLEDDPYGTLPMWQTGVGRVKNEFVLFDFGKPHRLASMKVWNFNDGRSNLHTSRGVKHADIYISTSGKWDPLKEPDEWTLVVDDFKFSVAPGTDDYGTPDVISFDNAEARFVAIVIGDHFGPDSRGVGGQECVGLSEVQFFGERISKSPRTKTNVP